MSFKSLAEKHIKYYKEMLKTSEMVDMQHLPTNEQEFKVYESMLNEAGLIIVAGKYVKVKN